MNDEFKALTIADLGRIAERCKADGYDAIFEHVADILIMGNADVHRWPPQFVDSVHRIAREILAERTSSEALKRAARVEELNGSMTRGWVAHGEGWDESWIANDHDHEIMRCSHECRRDLNGVVEIRTLAPALAADVRAYDAALRELVEALDERETAVPEAEAKVDAIARTQKEHWDSAQRARDRLDMKEYQRQVDLRNALDDSRNAARRERDDLRVHCDDRVNRAIEAARKVVNG